MTTDDPDARAAIEGGSSEPFDQEAYSEHPAEGAGLQDGRDHERKRLQSHLLRALRRIDVLREAELAATAEAVALQRELESFRRRAGYRLPVGNGPQRFVYGDENTIEWLRRELEWLDDYRRESRS